MTDVSKFRSKNGGKATVTYRLEVSGELVQHRHCTLKPTTHNREIHVKTVSFYRTCGNNKQRLMNKGVRDIRRSGITSCHDDLQTTNRELH